MLAVAGQHVQQKAEVQKEADNAGGQKGIVHGLWDLYKAYVNEY